MRGTSIMVEVHEDRVVISNPGGFPIGMSVAQLGDLSIRRNELIADMFARMHRVERIGSGFKRIRRFMEEAGLPFPMVESNSFFIIRFNRPPYSLKDETQPKVTEKVTEKVTVNQQGILKAIAVNQHIAAPELANIVGISERKIKDNLKKLKGKGLLKRIGPDKGGHWEVVK